jgi:hypothetical protein
VEDETVQVSAEAIPVIEDAVQVAEKKVQLADEAAPVAVTAVPVTVVPRPASVRLTSNTIKMGQQPHSWGRAINVPWYTVCTATTEALCKLCITAQWGSTVHSCGPVTR